MRVRGTGSIRGWRVTERDYDGEGVEHEGYVAEGQGLSWGVRWRKREGNNETVAREEAQ